MRPGGGKNKGSKFERKICVALSRWVTGGQRNDVFWRSAMSGGRATVAARKGDKQRQAGDITAVAPEGNALVARYYIECKAIRDIQLGQFAVNRTGPLVGFWAKARREAVRHSRLPLLIVKQNTWPVLVISDQGGLSRYGLRPLLTVDHPKTAVHVWEFERLLKCKYID